MSLSTRQHRLLVRFVDALEKAQEPPIFVAPPSAEVLANDLRVPRQAAEAILNIGIQVGAVRAIAPGQYVTEAQVEGAYRTLIALAESPASERGLLSPKLIRETFGASRSWSESLCRYFVEHEYLVRSVGGYRVPPPSFRPKPAEPPQRSVPEALRTERRRSLPAKAGPPKSGPRRPPSVKSRSTRGPGPRKGA